MDNHLLRERRQTFEAVAVPFFNELLVRSAVVVRNGAEAEDLVQEVYLRAWRCFHRFTLGTNCRAWLHKILFHCLRHRERNLSTSRLLLVDQTVLEQTVSSAPMLPEAITDAAILACIADLPPGFRQVLLLIDVEELSYRECAGALGIPVGTVMSRLNRARKALRDRLPNIARSYGLNANSD